jgi:hypothetical protein
MCPQCTRPAKPTATCAKREMKQCGRRDAHPVNARADDDVGGAAPLERTRSSRATATAATMKRSVVVRWKSQLGAGDVLVVTTKQDCTGSSNPSEHGQIAVEIVPTAVMVSLWPLRSRSAIAHYQRRCDPEARVQPPMVGKTAAPSSKRRRVRWCRGQVVGTGRRSVTKRAPGPESPGQQLSVADRRDPRSATRDSPGRPQARSTCTGRPARGSHGRPATESACQR